MADETTTLHVRVSSLNLAEFHEKCLVDFHRKPNDVLRELIRATADGRVKITPTEGQVAQNKDLYL